jgi:hypothetical protein
MSDKAFDLGAAQAELETLRRRGRELEIEIAADLKRRLRAMGTALYQATDTAALLEDVRRFCDERTDR